ncbi:Protein kinase domain [Sesbania bispinosa]|nr:Protein kinase domain [Sesbania bispinosa]
MMTKLNLRALVFSLLMFVPSLGKDLLSCETTSPDASGYPCYEYESQRQCETFALIHTNSYYSSLFNLTFYLGVNRFLIAEANRFPAETEFFSQDQPLLIPIDCKCKSGIFHAAITKTCIKGESFYGIAQSLEGLTTCKAIQDKNPGVSPWNLDDKVRLMIPLRCACPVLSKVSLQPRLLLSYPVREGDTISNLASKFNITIEAIISANHISSESFRPENLTPFTSLLIPLNGEPILGSLAKPWEHNSGLPPPSIPVISSHKKTKRMKRIHAREMMWSYKHLNFSIRTASSSKVSFEGSQYTHDGKIIDTTAHKKLLESYTIEEMRKATDNFNSSNHIEGSMYHGHLNGKSMAIKHTKTETVSKIDFGLFHDVAHHHPNIIRLLGTCLMEGPQSYLVFEYAKNGSLKDWLHGGLAIKNQFIASCYCFLTWDQRLRICLDVAMALQYMHQVMKPSYVHRNVKSKNIFLDEEFGAKIGNFGMVGCVENDTEDPKLYSTNPASWSVVYLAPEYVHQGIVSPSIDMFAYGVVLLEVLSGQTPISRSNEGSLLLTDKIKSILKSEDGNELREWMDSALGESYSFDAAVTLANIARACVEEDSSLRPSAGEVIEKLSRLVEELPEGEQHMLKCESSCEPLVMAVENIEGTQKM